MIFIQTDLKANFKEIFLKKILKGKNMYFTNIKRTKSKSFWDLHISLSQRIFSL